MKAWFAAVAFLLATPALAQPQDISAPGIVPHAAAHAGFPEQVGAFRRSHVLRYAPDDISANYNLRRGDDFLRLSIYIYPAPPVPRERREAACREVMSSIGAEIGQRYPDAERTKSGAAAALPGTEPGLRLRSVHRLQMALRGDAPEEVRRGIPPLLLCRRRLAGEILCQLQRELRCRRGDRGVHPRQPLARPRPRKRRDALTPFPRNRRRRARVQRW